MKTKLYLFVLFLVFGTYALLGQSSNGVDKTSEMISGHSTLEMLVEQCYICHNPRIKKEEDIIAPPMAAVKYMYKIRFKEGEDFTDRMTRFVMEPDNTKAIMKGPVMTHGVMPNLTFEEEEVRKIVKYLYENQIEEPVWFAEYFAKRYGEKWESQ